MHSSAAHAPSTPTKENVKFSCRRNGDLCDALRRHTLTKHQALCFGLNNVRAPVTQFNQRYIFILETRTCLNTQVSKTTQHFENKESLLNEVDWGGGGNDRP